MGKDSWSGEEAASAVIAERLGELDLVLASRHQVM